MSGLWEAGTVELTLPAEHFSSLIIAVHSATHGSDTFDSDPDTGFGSSRPRRGNYAEIADFDLHFARARLGLDHRPIAAVTVVHAAFIVDVTFDVVGRVASALFIDATEVQLQSAAPVVHGAAIMAFRTADALELCGLRSTLAPRAVPPGSSWI